MKNPGTKHFGVDAIQYIAPSYGKIRDFIESFGDNPSEILIKVWDDHNEHRNISNMSGTSHLAIRNSDGDFKIRNKDWIVRCFGQYVPCNENIFSALNDSVWKTMRCQCGQNALPYKAQIEVEKCSRCLKSL